MSRAPRRLPAALVLAAGVLVPEAGSTPSVRPRPLPDAFVAGVSFAMTNRPGQGYDSEAARCALADLAARGATAVSLMPFAFQDSPRAAALTFRMTHPSSETDRQIRAGIRAAHAAGLTVLVKPQVWVRGSWPGAIEHGSGADFRAWWTDYREYVLEKARLAAEEGAGGFCVGTELSRLQARPEWRALVADVRAIFPGWVVYAANWDAVDVPFADLLDACGVDLYEPLSADAAATDADLRAGARRVVARLDALAARAGRPVLLTEVGFAARRACWRRPNEELGAPDGEDQRRASRALLDALEPSEGVRGLFWWKAFSDGRAAAASDGSFRVTGRPAERELARFFGRATAARLSSAGRLR